MQLTKSFIGMKFVLEYVETNLIDKTCVVIAYFKFPHFYFPSTSGKPSTSDLGESTTVVMEIGIQEQWEALPKRMKGDTTQSHRDPTFR